MGLKHREVLTFWKNKTSWFIDQMINVVTCDILSAESEFYTKRSMLGHTAFPLSVSQHVSYGQRLG